MHKKAQMHNCAISILESERVAVMTFFASALKICSKDTFSFDLAIISRLYYEL